MVVVMTPEQAKEAFRVGVRRADHSIAKGRANTRGFAPDIQQRRHTDGLAAMAEYLVSLETGQPWTSRDCLDSDSGIDVGTDIDVKHTPNERGSLIVKRDAPDDTRYVLVVGEANSLRIVGWAWGYEIKREGRWRDDVRHPAFFYRPTRPIDDLRVVGAT